MQKKWIWLDGTITKKYILLFFFTLIIPIVVFYQLIVNYAESVVEKEILTNTTAQSAALTKRLNREVQDAVLQLRLIVGYAESPDMNGTTLQEMLKQVVSESAFIVSAYTVSPSGVVMSQAPFSVSGQPVFMHPDLEKVKWSKKYSVSPVYTNRMDQPEVSIAVPILNKEKVFVGMVVAVLSTDYLADVLRSNRLSEKYFGVLLDQKGTIISSTNGTALGASFSVPEIQNQLLYEYAGHLEAKYQGELSLMTYRSLQDGWRMVYGVSKDIAFAPITNLSRALTFIFSLLMILALILTAVGLRKMLYPILHVTSYAKNFPQQTSLFQLQSLGSYTAKDEIGILLRAVTRMGESNLRKQRDIERHKLYLHDVIEGIPYALITLDTEGRIVHVNERFEQMLSLSRSHLIGAYVTDTPIFDVSLQPLLELLYSPQTYQDKEMQLADTTGKTRIVKVYTSKLYTERYENIGVLAVLQDVTEMKLLEARVKQNEKLALAGQITAGLAHEIKNPLAILSSAAQLLREETEESTGDIRELVDDVSSVIARMNGIVNNFLSFARANPAVREPVVITQVVKEVLHLLRIKANEQGVKLENNMCHTQFMIMGRKDQLIQALLNIMLNSLDAMPHGGTLYVGLQELANGEIVLTVRDTGKGISKEEYEWLFEPFFTTKAAGTGLGLTIARDIIQEHQGEMRIYSREQEGTTVICTFYVKEAMA
ncbi:PAS domain-containing sensor histidine kinase [Ectobacillus ponti]|uniref:histidine kinase n=1 Tax=Ectobacillus ponti TaxID=2961894 RepID=A0AA41X8Y9_9BACI|nr:PAS domain-containing sensor histidine kinase [Ectobacillus ponti]MCP8970912.1 ATP-binding protein [Ectobacillus ponti]